MLMTDALTGRCISFQISSGMNWDSQLSSILSVADGSVAKMRVSTLKLTLSNSLVLLEVAETYYFR